ncbi:MAG: FtsH protease activity modulator HflK [Verrucomicrobiota bacterium]
MFEVQVGDKRVRIGPPSIKPGGILVAVAGLLLVSGVLTALYSVQAEEEAVVMRFGKFINTEGPGLHFKLPWGIDAVTHVAVRRQLKQEFGFGTAGNTNRYQWTEQDEQLREKQMVTGDLNAALVEFVVQYRIDQPDEYLFNVRNADETLRDASESIMREVVGDRTVDEVITIGRTEIESECLRKLQDLVNKYEMGLSIDQVQLINVNPPQPVQASFNEVNQAQQEKEKMINVANGEYNRNVPKASGEAEQKISEAEGYASQRVNEAEGDTAKFTALFREYQKAPEVTRRRIYLETMQSVLPELGEVIVIDEEASQVLPLLNLGKGVTP